MEFHVSTLLIASIVVLVSNPVDCDRQRMTCTVDETFVDNGNTEPGSNTRLQEIQGPVGPKGSRGFKGEQGSTGEVDYEKINATIKHMLESAIEKQRAELFDRIEKLEHPPPAGFSEQDIVRYDGRIFIALASETVRKPSAPAKCQELGGELANIYNQVHMDKIMTFIRDNKLNGEERKFFHLGMIYDPFNHALHFRNGTIISQRIFKWHIGYPVTGHLNSARTNMQIGVGEDSTNVDQYLINSPKYNSYVLCEI
ncbi:uncharacterized protein LOC120344427 [Styela clava]